MRNVYNYCYFLMIILSAFYPLTPTAQVPTYEYATNTANLSTTWTLNETDYSYYGYDTNGVVVSTFNPILLTETNVTQFALGFFCQGENVSCTSYLLAIFILSENFYNGSTTLLPVPLVWSANRDYLVQNNAILNFTAAGELVLRDADGTTVWTTNTAGKSVIGMNLTDTGNLVLYDVNNVVVWQSFDHPTDCLLPGQKLNQGQKLISSVLNWTSTQKGMYSLQVTHDGLFAYIESNPPQAYFKIVPAQLTVTLIYKEIRYVRFLSGSLSLFIHSAEPSDPDYSINIPHASSSAVQYMKLMPDGHLKVFELQLYFYNYYWNWKEVDDLLTPYIGECGYPLVCGRNASAPLSTSPNPFVSQKKKKGAAKVLGPAIGISVTVVVGFVMFIVHKKTQHIETEEEEYFAQVPGMPTRFSYAELKTATENFSKKLGQGGFGTVFEGILEDGSKIAVKCLEGLGQVNKSFLAEVESIGSIHHVNLVRLRGYSARKSERLLVYDFMSNGSLDRWIYYGDMGHVLEWECRKNIILHIAKGLAYLHEDCRQQIIHLDIKPQNILLDDFFNAKVSDFGLSKLVDKNQTQVMTTIKGTPGYIAPECWSSSIITEKVDVYSFGIVVLEILCGRKNFDRSLPEESWHLLGVFQKSWEQGSWLDMVDKYSEDMQANGAEVVEMMKVASWCLQTEFTRRPSMSSVVKVLEGGMSVESNLDYNFTDPRMQKTAIVQEKELTELMPSIISGPR